MDYLFYIGLGFGIIVLFLYIRAKRRKARNLVTSVDSICIHLISNHSAIQFNNDDTVRYFGSIINDEDSLSNFKLIYPYTDTDLFQYFKTSRYNGAGNNLLIYKVEKVNSSSYFIVIIDDPVDMKLNYSLFEVIGPLDTQ